MVDNIPPEIGWPLAGILTIIAAWPLIHEVAKEIFNKEEK